MSKAIVVAVVVPLGAAACGDDAPETGAALEHISQRSDNDSRVRTYDSVAELAERITARHDDGGYDERIVEGTVTSVERGASFRWEITDDGERRIELRYGDPTAMVDTVHLGVEVNEQLAPHASTQRIDLTVGVAFDAGFSFAQIEADYLALDDVVMFLEASPCSTTGRGSTGSWKTAN